MEDYHLVDAKQEYTTYLVSILEPSMYNGFRDIYEQAKHVLNGNSIYKNFQVLLSNVPHWNFHMLEKEVVDIQKETGCDWLDNLITAVFVSHSKILTSVKVGNYKPKTKKIDLKIPDTTNFIHQCYLDASRSFYKNPFLFLDDPKQIKPEVYLKNTQTCKDIIKESILSTVRKLLPFKSILNEYLSLENNMLALGGTTTETITPSTVHSSQLKVIEAPPVIITNKTNEQPDIVSLEHPNNNYSTTDDSLSEKETHVKGKILNLNDLEINHKTEAECTMKQNKKKIKKNKHGREHSKQIFKKSTQEDSINSKTVEKLVNDIKNEFKLKQINDNEKSLPFDNVSLGKSNNNKDIHLDDFSFPKHNKSIHLDFFSTPKKFESNIPEEKSDDSQTTLDRLNNILGVTNYIGEMKENHVDNSIQSKISKKNRSSTKNQNNQLILFHQQTPHIELEKESLDIEKIQQILKEEGTIISTKNKQQSNHNNKLVEKENSNGIKRISIKYPGGLSIGKKKGGSKKNKTTLIDEADDDDSSELVF